MPSLPAGFKLDPGAGEHLSFSGAEFIVRASADTTGGAFSIVEEVDPLDTPLHVHEHEDELFFVLEGKHVVQVGDEAFRSAGRPGLRPARRSPRAATGRAADGTGADHAVSGGVRGVLP